MANQTTNYKLKKPLSSEFYNIEDHNGNMDIIDTTMKAIADDAKPSGTKTTPVDADKLILSDSAASSKHKFITWANIKSALGSVFAAKTHSHTKSQITDFPTSMTPTAHSHKKSDISDFSHTHTKSEISDFAHTHTKSQISDFPTTMPPSSHTHKKSEITDFPSSMTPTSHASTHKAGGSDPLSAADIGAAPSINGKTSSYNMDTILKSGAHFVFYDTNVDTLGTPYKYGASAYTAAKILSYSNGENYGVQVAYMSGGGVLTRDLRNGTLTPWVAMYHQGNITSGTIDLTAGTSPLGNGEIYLVYE